MDQGALKTKCVCMPLYWQVQSLQVQAKHGVDGASV